MKFSSPRNLTDCGNIGKISFYFHAEWHGDTSEVPATLVSPEAKTEDADGGHYHGDVYHPTAHSPEVAQQEAQQKTDESGTAEAALEWIEPL